MNTHLKQNWKKIPNFKTFYLYLLKLFMAKIYALAFVSISEMRDSKIDSLFSDEPETFSGKWEYIWQNNSDLSKTIDFKCKPYKTLSGATRSANLLTKKWNGRKLRLRQGVIDPISRMWMNKIEFDSSTHKLVPIEITETWNKTIDNLITEKKKTYEREVAKLLSKKV